MLLGEIASVEVPAHAPCGMPALSRFSCATCHFGKSSFCSALFGKDAERDQNKIKHRWIAARRNIYRAGEPNEGALIVCEGWAVRFVQLPSGKRQILSVVLPGDLATSTSVFDEEFAFSIQAVTNVRYCYVPFADIRKKIQANPALLNLWLELTAAEYRRADKHIVALGQRTAQERVAALIVLIMSRFEARGELEGGQFPFPLRQQQIADFTGLTPVHVCRVLGMLRNNGICDVGHGIARVVDRAELERMVSLR